MSELKDYFHEAKEDAKEFIKNFKDEIFEQLKDENKASKDLLNDYEDGDAFINETYTNGYYTLLQASKLLEDLSEFAETDYSLWQGLEPIEAIKSQAAYTYTNAVCSFIREMIEEINQDCCEYFTEDWSNETEEKVSEIIAAHC